MVGVMPGHVAPPSCRGVLPLPLHAVARRTERHSRARLGCMSSVFNAEPRRVAGTSHCFSYHYRHAGFRHTPPRARRPAKNVARSRRRFTGEWGTYHQQATPDSIPINNDTNR